MASPGEDEDWTFISPQPTPEHVRNEQTQTENASDSDIDVLERFDVGSALETESLVSDFGFLRSGDLQVETCDFPDDFPDEEEEPDINLSPGFKAYSHIPNQSVNTQLNVLLVISVAAVAGLALGNYLGWSQSPAPDLSVHYQMMKLKQLQEELVSCKEHQVDGLNSTCLISGPTPSCNSPIITSTIIAAPKFNPVAVQVRSSVALSGFVQQPSVAVQQQLKKEPEMGLRQSPREIEKAKVSEDIIIETRRFFPLSFDGNEKTGITVWLLLSGKGISRPLFTKGLRRSVAVKKSHLDPFIETHFAMNQYKIWTEETGVSLIKADASLKSEDLAKRSEIEKEAEEGATGRFWAKVMKKVFKKGRKFETKLELEERITDVLLVLRQEYFHHLWTGFRKKVMKLRGRKI